MAAVRQHHNLATTGKLGQQQRKPVSQQTSVMNDRGASGASDSHKGSATVRSHKRGK